MRSIVVCLAVAAAAAGCGSDTVFGIGEQGSLARHEQQWKSQSLHAYEFDLVQDKLGQTSNVRVTVMADTIYSVVDKDTGLPPAFYAGYPTVDDLFASARAALSAKSVTVTLEYDEHLGYPTRFSAVSNANDPGGRPYSAQVSNLVAVANVLASSRTR
jgi:hypothetical protein